MLGIAVPACLPVGFPTIGRRETTQAYWKEPFEHRESPVERRSPQGRSMRGASIAQPLATTKRVLRIEPSTSSAVSVPIAGRTRSQVREAGRMGWAVSGGHERLRLVRTLVNRHSERH
jgi:hypothetical protein